MLEIFLIVWVLCTHCSFSRRDRTKYYIMMFLPFLVLLGVRDVSIGLDTYQYASGYEKILNMAWSDIFLINDPAWAALEKLSSYIYPNYYFWQCLYAVIYFAIYSTFIKRYCNNKLLAIAIFLSTGLYTYAFNISRQMLSIAFFVLSWDLLNRNMIGKCIVFYLLALLTHISSIVSFPILLLARTDIKVRYGKLLPIILFILFSFFTVLITKLGVYIPHYDKYLSNTLETNGGGLIKVVWAIELMFSIYVYYFSSKAFGRCQIAALGTMFYIGANIIGFSFNYAERIGYIFMPFTLLVFDQVLFDIKKRGIRKMFTFVEIICFLCFFYLAFRGLEYKTFL